MMGGKISASRWVLPVCDAEKQAGPPRTAGWAGSYHGRNTVTGRLPFRTESSATSSGDGTSSGVTHTWHRRSWELLQTSMRLGLAVPCTDQWDQWPRSPETHTRGGRARAEPVWEMLQSAECEPPRETGRRIALHLAPPPAWSSQGKREIFNTCSPFPFGIASHPSLHLPKPSPLCLLPGQLLPLQRFASLPWLQISLWQPPTQSAASSPQPSQRAQHWDTRGLPLPPQHIHGPVRSRCRMVSAPPLFPGKLAWGTGGALLCQGIREWCTSHLLGTHFSISGNTLVSLKLNACHVLHLL